MGVLVALARGNAGIRPPCKNPFQRGAADVAAKISLPGSVPLGTGVMIGAGIFALVGQVAELAGSRLAHHDEHEDNFGSVRDLHSLG